MAALNLNNGNVDGLFHPYYQHNEVNRMNSVFEIIDRVFEVIGNDGDDNELRRLVDDETPHGGDDDDTNDPSSG